MRTLVTVAAAGNSAWIPTNYLQKPFVVSLAASITSGAVLTYKVQHSFDDPQKPRPVTALVRVGTAVTVMDPDHRLSVGDSVNIMNSGDPNLDGTYDVASVVDADNYTYTVANTGILVPSAPWNVRVVSLRVYDHADFTGGISVRKDGNYAFPVQACRLRVTAYTSGKVDLEVTQGNR